MAKNIQNKDSDVTNVTISEKKKFLDIFKKKDTHISNSCIDSKISRQTYYRSLEDEDFKQAIEDVKESLKDDTEDYLLQACKAGNITAIIFRCKTILKDRGYDETHKIQIDKPFDRIELEGV